MSPSPEQSRSWLRLLDTHPRQSVSRTTATRLIKDQGGFGEIQTPLFLYPNKIRMVCVCFSFALYARRNCFVSIWHTRHSPNIKTYGRCLVASSNALQLIDSFIPPSQRSYHSCVYLWVMPIHGIGNTLTLAWVMDNVGMVIAECRIRANLWGSWGSLRMLAWYLLVADVVPTYGDHVDRGECWHGMCW
jgi:hypothetical protein